MPRKARQKSESGIYHIITRGVNRQAIFEDDDDRQQYYMVLAKAKDKSPFELYAYCFMDNHVHLLIREGAENVSDVMRRIGSSYVYRYNKKYDRVGYLFQDRYRSEPVCDDQYFMTVLRYIHNNPLKAGIVKSIEDYKWSSFDDYLKDRGITDTEFALNMFAKNKEKALNLFDKFHQEINDDQCLDIDLIDRLNDEEALRIILKTFEVESIAGISDMNRQDRDLCIKRLKNNYRLSVRQIEKLTGINRGIIARA
ncbi:MAG: transposase [Firmicutes bacterium]|nr:transposase [Bacillota bacterium]